MRTRKVNENGEWVFGNESIAEKSEAIKLIVVEKLNSFLGNCFYDDSHGIDWFKYFGKSPKIGQLEIDVKRAVLSVEGVESITFWSVDLNDDRKLTITISYMDKYGNERTSQVNSDKLGV